MLNVLFFNKKKTSFVKFKVKIKNAQEVKKNLDFAKHIHMF